MDDVDPSNDWAATDIPYFDYLAHFGVPATSFGVAVHGTVAARQGDFPEGGYRHSHLGQVAGR
jgi:hypothetical protein